MKQTSKFILGLKRGKDFNDTDRHKIIQEYLSSGMTKKEIWQKHTGQSAENGQLLSWKKWCFRPGFGTVVGRGLGGGEP